MSHKYIDKDLLQAQTAGKIDKDLLIRIGKDLLQAQRETREN